MSTDQTTAARAFNANTLTDQLNRIGIALNAAEEREAALLRFIDGHMARQSAALRSAQVSLREAERLLETLRTEIAR